jgi:zinc protease
MNIQGRWHRWCIPLVVAAIVVAVLPATAQPDMATPSPYQTIKLDNGLDVVVIENHNVPLVTIDIAVRNGAFTEPDEFAGLSHLYEHMFFKANAAIPSQEQFMKRVRELGISFNGYTSEEIVTYFFTLPSRNLEPGVKFMADAIKSPLFKEDELTKEREVVLGEFDRNEAQPTFNLRYAIDSAMWMPYVSRKQALGQRQVIKTATSEKMQMIKDRFYLPNNSALIVSGDVKAADVFALAKKYLNDWKRGADPFPQYNPPAFPPLQSKLVVREARIPEASLQMLFRGPSVGKDEPDPYTAALISTILRQPTSRFYHNLNDSGLATDSYVGFNSAHNVSELVFDMDASPEKAHHALEQLKREIQAMARPGYFTPEEIATGKKIVASRSVFEQDNPMRFTIGTTAQWWSMASLDYYLKFPMNVQRVTEADIIGFVNRYLLNQPFVLGVGADRKTLDQMNFTQEALSWK